MDARNQTDLDAEVNSLLATQLDIGSDGSDDIAQVNTEKTVESEAAFEFLKQFVLDELPKNEDVSAEKLKSSLQLLDENFRQQLGDFLADRLQNRYFSKRVAEKSKTSAAKAAAIGTAGGAIVAGPLGIISGAIVGGVKVAYDQINYRTQENQRTHQLIDLYNNVYPAEKIENQDSSFYGYITRWTGLFSSTAVPATNEQTEVAKPSPKS